MAPIKTEQYEWQGRIKKCAKTVFLTLAFGLAVGGATAAQASGKSVHFSNRVLVGFR